MDPLAFLLAHQATRTGIRGAAPSERPERGRRLPAAVPTEASDARALLARGERGGVPAGGRRARALRALVQRP